MDSCLENLNFARDPRSCEQVKAPIVHLDDGSEVELPMKWALCHVCDGKGTHVNPSIDAGGLGQVDFYNDPQFAIDYKNGVYDIQCNACGGRTTIPVVDWDALDEEQTKAYEQQLRDEADCIAEQLAEIRMGC